MISHYSRIEQLQAEHPECDPYECRECTRKQSEIYSNEGAFDTIRENLEGLVEILSSKDKLDRIKLDSLMLSICHELGVSYSHSTVDRAFFYKLQSK